MIFLEAYARPLVLLHAIAAGVLVGVATHHLQITRRYLRGRFGQAALERRYARVLALAYLVTFGLGLLAYPTYKVRVRAEYLDAPVALAAEQALRAEAARAAGSPPAAAAVRDRSWVARLFDVKEHWAALGWPAALALWALSRRAHPADQPRFTAVYLGLSALVCGCAWLAALVGLLTAGYRPLGS